MAPAKSKAKLSSQISDLIAKKGFDKCRKDGDILDIEAMAKRLGYSESQARRICAAGKIGCFTRGEQYFTTPAFIEDYFQIDA